MAVGLFVGWMGASLLFLRDQCAAIEDHLLQGFEMIVLFQEGISSDRLKILEEKLKAMSGVEAVLYVSKQDALERLRQFDSDIAQNISFLDDNPLPASYQMRVAPSILTSLGSWVDQVLALDGVADMRYPVVQAEAFLQTRFYHRFLDLVLATMALLTLLFVGWCLFRYPPVGAERNLSAFLVALGSGVGLLACQAAVLPMRTSSLLWRWPSWTGGAGLLLGAFLLGWSISAYLDSTR